MFCEAATEQLESDKQAVPITGQPNLPLEGDESVAGRSNRSDELDAAEENGLKEGERPSLRRLLQSAIGMDLASISIPITYNEPLTFLQRVLEHLQYHELLERANEHEDPLVRLLYVTVFAISCFANTDRKFKPFNPLLGETFQYTNEKENIRFFSEQVSHHPPITASYCEGNGWRFSQSQNVKTKFLGNSLDVSPNGNTHVFLDKFREHYSWPNIHTIVHNLIVGRMWIDHFGTCKITVQDCDTGNISSRYSQITYQECGWFGRHWREVNGQVFDNSTAYLVIDGKWNSELTVTVTASWPRSTENEGLFGSTPKTIWKHTPELCTDPKYAKYEWTKNTLRAIELDDQIRQNVLLTDSRLREDRLMLQEGDVSRAAVAKHELEEAQRTRKNYRAQNDIQWSPRHFVLAANSEDECARRFFDKNDWVFKGWSQRRDQDSSQDSHRPHKIISDEDASMLWRLSKDW
ncbi:oxysterol-binding protein 8-like [Schistocerca gregaria]|uniref:oxysterol-binding protein 8-like n=1 Tax=Schistocerca gregaria TaxID=7010 RepID=UPI00211EEB47|nr:oxysterol-binding protein 8-like [Schistocerca gregaria]